MCSLNFPRFQHLKRVPACCAEHELRYWDKKKLREECGNAKSWMFFCEVFTEHGTWDTHTSYHWWIWRCTPVALMRRRSPLQEAPIPPNGARHAPKKM